MSKTITNSGNSTKHGLVFFGSGPVAAKSLGLLAQNFKIEAVITKPSTLAEMRQIKLPTDTEVYTVSTKQELDSLISSATFNNQIGILIDFGIIVSRKVIDYFKKGILNSHFSLLPEWRGADPITFAILSGQSQTGVSLMLIDEGMDTGELLAQADYDIPVGINTPELTQDLIELSDSCLKQVIPMWLNNEINPAPQEQITIAPSSIPTYSRKLTKQDGFMSFNKSADKLEREIRAFIEWPKSRTTLASKDVIITKASVKQRDGLAKVGVVYKTQDEKIGIHCETDDLIIEELKPAGKNTMPAKAFLAGYGKLL